MSIETDAPTALDRKSWSSLVARYALAGWQLWRSDPDDGVQRYFAGRWGLIRVLADTDEVDRFLGQLTGQKGTAGASPG